MTLRDCMSKVADKVRAIASKASIDERPTAVTIRTRTWTGGRRGTPGGHSDVDVVLTPRPAVVEVTGRDIAASAGRYSISDVKVGPITPAYTGGGYTQAQLAPDAVASGVEIIYVLAGNVVGEYARIDLSTDLSHSWFLVLRRRRTTP